MVKRQRWLSVISKLVLVSLALSAYGYIISRLVNFQLWDSIYKSVNGSLFTLAVAGALLVLWLANIFTETKKWQALLLPYFKLSFATALKQVLAGTVTAVGSPARIAEMGGRMALLAPAFRINAALMTGIGGLMQNLIICLGGLAVILLPQSPLNKLIRAYDGRGFYYLLIGIAAFISIIGFGYSLWGKKIKQYLLTLKKINSRVILSGLFWTLLRYLTYNFQLYLWMLLFGISPDVEIFIIYSPIYFLLITIIPSYLLIDLGIRGSVALLLFSVINQNEPLILAAIFAQWLSNVVLPTLFGSYILFRYKVIKQ